VAVGDDIIGAARGMFSNYKQDSKREGLSTAIEARKIAPGTTSKCWRQSNIY
jgi:hypothetical protein